MNKDITLLSKIDSLINQSNNHSLNDSVRFNHSIRAKKLAEKHHIDSLVAKSLFQLVKLSYPLKSKDSFLHYYPLSLNFSKLIKDTLHIAQTHNFTAYFYQKHQIIDSAYHHYYQGSKYFKFLKDNYQTGKMLLNMAIIQKNKRDYKGSEEVTRQALEYLSKTNNKLYVGSAYNNLGIINNELKKLSVSIKYHKKALELFKTLKDKPILTVESINNIIVAYKNNGDFDNAFTYFDSIQPYKKLLEEHPIVKARVLDNMSHTRLLSGDTENVLEDMEEALSIRRQKNHLTGIMVSLLHLSEYYRFINSHEKSFHYALEAKKLSGDYQNQRDVLNALRILTLNKFGKGNASFIEEFYSTLDQVEKVENSVADEFARIRLEVDENLKEKTKAQKKVQEQEQEIKNNRIIITLISGITILILIVLYLIWQSSKYRRELYKEFSHRTKQNLTSIKRGISKLKTNDRSNSHVKELEASTESQLILHSLLEQSNYHTHVDLNDYCSILINTLIFIYPDYKVSSHFDLTPVKITSKKASLVGKIISEFIINAFKHGFSVGKENNIDVVLNLNDKKVINIYVSTNGKKWDPKPAMGKGDGMTLMHSLSKKIPAEMHIVNENNTTKLNLKIKID
ncbi:hypothetical protein Q4Q34_08890 [Flavivirga abyssicola]|uniref:hypothetical protein n=1 Tax=Flavivirga abyssicola TaxID=3063533 RepID=UPI0026E06080|nr:hypothetical protein [Flavivirga sp. MEBiC07777]WVK15143.1 hypothetical protein Q4Q34_08890 [Flavivirga sp. MEBiC07777]